MNEGLISKSSNTQLNNWSSSQTPNTPNGDFEDRKTTVIGSNVNEFSAYKKQ